jgi:hypothetical protein
MRAIRDRRKEHVFLFLTSLPSRVGRPGLVKMGEGLQMEEVVHEGTAGWAEQE